MKPNYEKLLEDNIIRNNTAKNKYLNKGVITTIIGITILISQCFIIQQIKLSIKDEIINTMSKRLQDLDIKNDIQALINTTTDIQSAIGDIPMIKGASLYYQNNFYDKLRQLKHKNQELINEIQTKKHCIKISQTITTILTPSQIEKTESLADCKLETNCYRMSRDGYTAKAFHEKCDELKPTITIIQMNDNILFGGFTEATWDGNGLKYDNKAFLFSLNLSRRFGIRFNMPAINAVPSLLPTFGERDIYISEKESFTLDNLRSYQSGAKDESRALDYDDKIGFKIKDIEVFGVKCEDKRDIE